MEAVQNDEVGQAVLIGIVHGHGTAVGCETVAEFLRARLAIGGTDGENAIGALVQNDRQARLGAGLKRANHTWLLACRQEEEWWERRCIVLVEFGHANLVFVGAQNEYLACAIALPVTYGQLAYARQRWKGLASRESAVGLLQMSVSWPLSGSDTSGSGKPRLWRRPTIRRDARASSC